MRRTVPAKLDRGHLTTQVALPYGLHLQETGQGGDGGIHDDAYLFSRRNDTITNASRSEVQNDPIASRGVQTIGSPSVLHDVFTNTGTTARFSKAFRRS